MSRTTSPFTISPPSCRTRITAEKPSTVLLIEPDRISENYNIGVNQHSNVTEVGSCL